MESEESSMVNEHTGGTDHVGDVVGMLRTLSDPTRLRLLALLQEGEYSVTALCDALQLAQPTVSHHLGRLRTAKLVANRRAGKQVFYSLNSDLVSTGDEPSVLSIESGSLELRICPTTNNGV